jgi:peptidase E
VPTASGGSEQYLLKSYASFAKLPATAAHLPLFRLAATDLRSYVLGQEIIYVGGGTNPIQDLTPIRRFETIAGTCTVHLANSDERHG